MNTVLKAEKREGLGANYSAKIKEHGLIPSVIYDGAKTLNISVNEKFFTQAFNQNKLLSNVFDLEINGEIIKVAVKDYQINHITQGVIHIDFVKLEKNKYVKFKIPLYFINKSKSIAIKKGAVLNIVTYYIFLSCLNDEIPPYLVIDLENSDVLDKYFVESLNIPESATILQPKQLLANFKGKRGQALKADS
jgi:large subunit ribosomal protein L25